MKRARISVAAIFASLAIIASPREVWAYHQGDERLVDDTAHTLRSGEVRLGLLSADLGTVPFVTIGTDTLPWAAGPLYLGSVLVNGHVKVRLVRTHALTLALRGALYYSSLNNYRGTSADGHAVLVPLTLFTSSDIGRDLSLHLEATYATLDAKGDLEIPVAAARAAVAANALQTGVMLEYRATRALALILLWRHQPWATPGVIHTTSNDVGNGAKVTLAGNVETADASTFAVVGGVALSGETVNVRAGAGYGSLFLPFLGAALPGRTFVPEIDIYVRF